MEKQSMCGKRWCGNFAWRDGDPTWQAERKNDKTVFRKIRRETMRGRSVDKVIAALFAHPLWASRMSGKTPKSWKARFYLWRINCRRAHREENNSFVHLLSPPTFFKFGNDVQAEKSSFDPCKHWAELIAKRFLRETVP